MDQWGGLRFIDIYNRKNGELIDTISTIDTQCYVTSGLRCDYTAYKNLYNYQLNYTKINKKYAYNIITNLKEIE